MTAWETEAQQLGCGIGRGVAARAGGGQPPPSGRAGLRPRIGSRRKGGGTLAASLAQKLLTHLGLPLPGRLRPRPRVRVRVRTERGTEVSWAGDAGGPQAPADLGLVEAVLSRGAGQGLWPSAPPECGVSLQRERQFSPPHSRAQGGRSELISGKCLPSPGPGLEMAACATAAGKG